MTRFKKYPEYKDSGIEWLGEIPKDWQIDRLKWSVTDCKNGIWGNEPDGGDEDLACIRVADFDRLTFRVSTEKLTMRSIPVKDRRERLLSSGDLLIEKSGGGEQQLVGAVVRFDHAFPAVTSNFVARMPTAPGMNSRYWSYAHAHLYASKVNYRSIKQTTGIQNLDSQQYLDELMAYPPLPDQDSIADFLDFTTSQIDTLIERKRALITRLTELRTALISDAVTKGLIKTVQMKDSGIEWISMIPEGWFVYQLKRVAQISYGVGGEIDRSLLEGTKLLSLPNITIDGTLLTADFPYCELEPKERKEVLLKKGDLLFNWRNGSSDHLGKTAYFDLDGDWAHVSFLLKLRFNPAVSESRYFQYMLTGLRLTGFFSSSKAGVNNTFNLNELANLWIMNPPRDEQVAIAKFLDERTTKLDLQKAKIQTAIEALLEYRRSLVNAAVTGKIDVREYKPTKSRETESAHA